MVFRTVPLFSVLLIFYNAVILFFRWQDPAVDPMSAVLLTFTLPSEAIWTLTFGDSIIIMGLGVLYIELIKSTRASDQSILEHTFSMFVFLIYLLEFLLFPLCGDSTFLILCFMSLLDVIAGFTISISAARRDLTVS